MVISLGISDKQGGVGGANETLIPFLDYMQLAQQKIQRFSDLYLT